MSKIICDVCGTTYPETAAQCPICGCATPGEVDTVAEEMEMEEEVVAYTPTKGGRFSKSNVRKRMKENETAEEEEPVEEEPVEEEPVEEEVEVEEEKKSNKGLMITAIILLLAIVAVIFYIAVRFFLPADFLGFLKPTETTVPTTAVVETTVPEETTVAPTETEPATIPCTGLNVADTSVILDEAGKMWLLNISAEPAGTTDEIVFTSNNEAVATVDSQGCITAIAPGEAIINISCGNASANVLVDCVFIGEETEATEATTAEEETTEATEMADPNAEYTVLFYGDWREDNDITLAYGEVVEVTLEDDEGNEAKVTWVADEEGIVEIDGTTFTGNNPGIAYVTAEYGGKTYTIIVRVW